MAVVLLADDAYAFMVAWETMAIASYFLVTSDHRNPEIRKAGYLYLLIAHIGAIAILLCFGVLQAGTGDDTFAGMRAVEPTGSWATMAFLLALLPDSVRRPVSSRCTSGCPRRTRPPLRRHRH